MATGPKKVVIYINGERREVEDPWPKTKAFEIPVVTLGELKAKNASIRVNCRAFACWKVSDIAAREIDAPDTITNLKDLHLFGLKCPHCKCAFLMVSVA